MSERRICKYCGMELSEDVPHGLRQCHLHAVARIAELEAAQRWVPVSERLPEKTDTVLVLADGVRVIATYHSNKNKWELLWWISSEIYGVTHWIPLPKLDRKSVV